MTDVTPSVQVWHCLRLHVLCDLQVCVCTRTSTTERSRCGMTDVTPSVPVKMATLDSTDVRRGKFDICPLHLTLFRFKNKKTTNKI